jgi:hypothetical protein
LAHVTGGLLYFAGNYPIQMQQPVHRHSRNRNVWMEGLNFEGLSGNFGKIAVGILLLVGIILASSGKRIDKSDLRSAVVHAMNKPYQPGLANNKKLYLILPVKEGKKILIIESFALKAGGMENLKTSIQANDELTVWMDQKNDSLLRESGGGMRPVVTLLQKGPEFLISEDAYNRELRSNSMIGWWVIAMALSMVPYFFIQSPRIPPAWVFLGVLTAMIVWLLVQ